MKVVRIRELNELRRQSEMRQEELLRKIAKLELGRESSADPRAQRSTTTEQNARREASTTEQKA